MTTWWVLQANLRDRRFLGELQAVLDELGERWCAVPVVPFVPALPEVPAEVRATDARVVCYGPSFVPRVAADGRWRPGIFFDAATFRWSAMAAAWGERMFSADGVACTVADVVGELRESAVAEAWFVRPDADSKAFDGGVYADAATFEAALGTTPRDTPVIRAPARPVDAEWRCFVVDGVVVDASEYRRAGRVSLHRGAPPRAIDLVEAAATRWMPAAIACVDVASSGDHFGIVEANCFNASRFYAADTATVVAAVAASVRRAK